VHQRALRWRLSHVPTLPADAKLHGRVARTAYTQTRLLSMAPEATNA